MKIPSIYVAGLIALIVFFPTSIVLANDAGSSKCEPFPRTHTPPAESPLILIGVLSGKNNQQQSTPGRSGCCSWRGGVCGCDGATGHAMCCDGHDSPSCGCD